MNALSERLSLIASLIPKGVSVCDVGTDHGYLPAALYLRGGASYVTATDLSEKPLENARKNLEKLKVTGVRLICCDGLSGVEESYAQWVVIAGMGGDVMSGIIDRCPYKDKVNFVLQPMTAAKKLRLYLNEKGFSVVNEQAIKENNKLYTVMVCRKSGNVTPLSESEKYIGIIKNDSEINRQYIEKQYRICLSAARELKNVPERKQEYNDFTLAAEELARLLEG